VFTDPISGLAVSGADGQTLIFTLQDMADAAAKARPLDDIYERMALQGMFPEPSRRAFTAFAAGPTYQAMDRQAFWEAALDTPMSEWSRQPQPCARGKAPAGGYRQSPAARHRAGGTGCPSHRR
jgi:hypothetical protein